VPVTVLSRCQRLTCAAVEADVLDGASRQYRAKRENVEVEPEALGISRARPEGSVRDSLVRSTRRSRMRRARCAPMRRGRCSALPTAPGIDLFDSLCRGDIAGAFREFREQYDTRRSDRGALRPRRIRHFVTRVKIVPATADNVEFGETERRRDATSPQARCGAVEGCGRCCSRASPRLKPRRGQRRLPKWCLVRIAYVADMPTPDEAIRMLEQNGGASPVVAGNAASRSAPAPSTSSMQSRPRAASQRTRSRGRGISLRK